MEYDFTLKFKLPDICSDMDELIEQLGEAGCDDGRDGDERSAIHEKFLLGLAFAWWRPRCTRLREW